MAKTHIPLFEEYTNSEAYSPTALKIYDMCEDGILDWADVAARCLAWMDEPAIKSMATANRWFTDDYIQPDDEETQPEPGEVRPDPSKVFY